MNRIAIDVVLLPDEAVTALAVRANAELIRRGDRQIALDNETCLPHISLAMGCIEREAVEPVKERIEAIASECPIGELVITGVVTSLNAQGQSVSALALARTGAIQGLHERVMDVVQPYLSQEVTAAAIFGAETVAETTLAWIRDYREKAAFGGFFPHITIGYGRVKQVMSFPIPLVAPSMALCHLGNHCTCRKVLASVPLGKSISTE
jgi:2'-5' RNA ligase